MSISILLHDNDMKTVPIMFHTHTAKFACPVHILTKKN